jgi:16S rRNA (cytidine1402-2'-O)-methyltransferase
MFEENKRGSLVEVRDHFQAKGVKGEIVIIVEGAPEKQNGRNTKEAHIDEE